MVYTKPSLNLGEFLKLDKSSTVHKVAVKQPEEKIHTLWTQLLLRRKLIAHSEQRLL